MNHQNIMIIIVMIISIIFTICSGYNITLITTSNPPYLEIEDEVSHDENIFLNPLILRKSILNYGNINFKTIQSLFDGNKCLTFVTIGGSVSCGLSHEQAKTNLDGMKCLMIILLIII